MKKIKKELKTVIKIFNRRKNQEHFRDKSKDYNYEEIKQRNKKLNDEFKRIFKLMKFNIYL
jgi:hypothetical protein